MAGVIVVFFITWLGWLFGLEGRITTPFSDRLLKAWIFTHAQIFLTVLVTGGAGFLSLATVLPIHAAVLTAVYLKRKRDMKDVRAQWKTAIVRFLRNLPGVLKSSPASVLFIIIAAAELAWLGIYSAAMPIHGWDALAYHLAIPAGIAKTGSLKPLPVSYENVINYVGTPHLFYGWAALFPIKSGFLSVFHWSYLLAAILSVHACLRSLDIGGLIAALTASAAGMAPIFILESVRLYADIAVAALFMACAVQFYHWMRTRNRISLMAAALALGLMHGAKLQCVLFTVILLVWVVLFMKQPRRDLFRPATASLLLISLLAGSFWFFYRYHRFNNPLHPVEVRVLGHTFFPGPIAPVDEALDFRVKPPLLRAVEGDLAYRPLRKTAKIIISWLELSRTQHDYIHTVSGGFCPLMVVLLIPAALGALILRLPGRAFLFLPLLLGYTQLGHVSRYTPMISLLFAVPAGVFLGSGGAKRYLVPMAALLLCAALGIAFPFLASGFGEIILEGPLREISSGRSGPGTLFFSAFIALAVLASILKRKDAWVFLFIPVLLIAVGLTYHFPDHAQVSILSADRDEKRAFCFARRPLHQTDTQWEQMKLGNRGASESRTGDILYYSGDPYPCTMGMMWNEEMSNMPLHTRETPLPGKILGCKEDYCVSIVPVIPWRSHSSEP